MDVAFQIVKSKMQNKNENNGKKNQHSSKSMGFSSSCVSVLGKSSNHLN